MDNETRIWTILRSDFTQIAAAAIIGNLISESALKPDNVQNSYENKLGSDKVYTERVDSGVYGREKFAKDGAGYGLAQWTHHSRKGALWDFMKITKGGYSIGDLDAQSEFILLEIESNAKLFNDLNACTQLRQAVEIVLKRYERPADQSDANVTRRTKNAQGVLDRHATVSTDATKEQIKKALSALDEARTILEGLI